MFELKMKKKKVCRKLYHLWQISSAIVDHHLECIWKLFVYIFISLYSSSWLECADKKNGEDRWIRKIVLSCSLRRNCWFKQLLSCSLCCVVFYVSEWWKLNWKFFGKFKICMKISRNFEVSVETFEFFKILNLRLRP